MFFSDLDLFVSCYFCSFLRFDPAPRYRLFVYPPCFFFFVKGLKTAVAQQDFHLLQDSLKEGKKMLLEEEVEGGTRFLCPEVRVPSMGRLMACL